MRVLLIMALAAMPGLAMAAGGGSSTPTTAKCKGTQVYDKKTKKCVNAQESSLDADTLYGAVRELAYAGRYADAQGVLTAMPDQQDDRVLTYWGFTHRKMGNGDLAREYYQAALSRNPDNLLARSYMAQGMISDGNMDGAITQWREIMARGGKGTWAETSLSEAIRTGVTYNY